jgi:hypothetical protein
MAHGDLPYQVATEDTAVHLDRPAKSSTSGWLLTAIEVGLVFRVSAKTVCRWALTGRLKGIQTPGGQWRFLETDVRDALRDAEIPDLTMPHQREPT